MRRQRSGHVINISSVAGVVGLKHCNAYGATKFAVEGLWLATAQKVGQFGIKVTVVEAGFFLTDLLAAANVRYAKSAIADYAPEGTAEAMWSPYDGKQIESPDKLGDALVELTRMANPPQVFVGGSDCLATVTLADEARIQGMRDNEALSRPMEPRTASGGIRRKARASGAGAWASRVSRRRMRLGRPRRAGL